MPEKEKIVLYVPMRYKPGEYGIWKLNRTHEVIGTENSVAMNDEMKLVYEPSRKSVKRITGPEVFDYFEMYRVYFSNLDRLTAVYDENYELINIGISDSDSRRLLYLRIDSLEYAKDIFRHCAGKIGRELAGKVLLRKDKGRARRLFAEYYVDGESFEYHVIYASEQEVQEVWDDYAMKHGADYVDKFCGYSIIDYIDNSGEYSHADENMDCCERGCDRIAVLLSCVRREWWDECFGTVIETLDGSIKAVIPQLDTTEDFKFISEIYD